MPTYDIQAFKGPLDLLDTIIRERRDALSDLPIAEITDQYLEVLENSRRDGFDMELASEFVLMAATLLQIKSMLLLPARKAAEEEGPDPRDELVLRLMAYRRARLLAGELERRFACYSFPSLKAGETPARLGLDLSRESAGIDRLALDEAADALAARNAERFRQNSKRIRQLLRRERFSVKDKMREMLAWLFQERRFFFHERFPLARCSRAERVSAFLALLELLRENRARATQKEAFSAILVESDAAAEEGGTTWN